MNGISSPTSVKVAPAGWLTEVRSDDLCEPREPVRRRRQRHDRLVVAVVSGVGNAQHGSAVVRREGDVAAEETCGDGAPAREGDVDPRHRHP